VIDNVNKWISGPKNKKHKIGFNYEIYESIKIPQKSIDSLYDYIAHYILKNYISPEEWNSIKKNKHIKNKSMYIKDTYIPSDTGNFGLKTGEFCEIVSKLVFENRDPQ
jgi:hypothetical protein